MLEEYEKGKNDRLIETKEEEYSKVNKDSINRVKELLRAIKEKSVIELKDMSITNAEIVFTLKSQICIRSLNAIKLVDIVKIIILLH